LGILNGGGWGCIYSPQPLPSHCFISANRGRSALLVRTVHPCTSMAKIPTISSNVYINGYNALNVSSDVRERQSWTVRSCTPDDPRGRHNSFYRTRHLRVFGSVPTGRSAPGPRRCLLFHQTVRSVDLRLCSVPVRGTLWCRGRSVARARTVRAWSVFSKKFLLSRIIYGIPNSRFRIVVDELMHM
jgi:hypothetical protein